MGIVTFTTSDDDRSERSNVDPEWLDLTDEVLAAYKRGELTDADMEELIAIMDGEVTPADLGDTPAAVDEDTNALSS